MPARKVIFDFGAFAAKLMELPAPRTKGTTRADLGKALLNSLMNESCSGSFLVALPEDAFEAAHEILDGDSEDPEIQAASEEIDEEGFHHLLHRVSSLAATPDPSLAPEFI